MLLSSLDSKENWTELYFSDTDKGRILSVCIGGVNQMKELIQGLFINKCISHFAYNLQTNPE